MAQRHLQAHNAVAAQEDAMAAVGLRSAKAFAVADALTKKGYTVDRATELAISRTNSHEPQL